MNQNDKVKFAFLMAKLEEAFSEQITKEKAALYFEYLDDLNIGQIERAINFIIERRERKGIPTIAEIRSATLGSTEYKAVEAWGELLEQTYKIEKKFINPLIPKVAKIAFGSLKAFYNEDNRNEMSDRAYFIKTYQLIANLEEANAEHKKKLKINETKIVKIR